MKTLNLRHVVFFSQSKAWAWSRKRLSLWNSWSICLSTLWHQTNLHLNSVMFGPNDSHDWGRTLLKLQYLLRRALMGGGYSSYMTRHCATWPHCVTWAARLWGRSDMIHHIRHQVINMQAWSLWLIIGDVIHGLSVIDLEVGWQMIVCNNLLLLNSTKILLNRGLWAIR